MRSIISRFAAFALTAAYQNEAGEGNDLAGAAPKPVLTLAEKLTAKATALHSLITSKTTEYNDILAQLKAIDLVANVKSGDTVTAVTGKGEKAVSVTGVVLGVHDEESGKLIKVQAGSGFDTTVYTFRSAQVTEVVPYVALEAQASDEVEMPVATPEFDAEPTNV